MSLNNLTVPELRKQAKSKGIVGYSRLRKAQLVSKLQNTRKKVRHPKLHVHLGGTHPLSLRGGTIKPDPFKQTSLIQQITTGLPPPPPPVPPRLLPATQNDFGKEIFRTFVKKYVVQKLFDSRRKEIQIELKANKIEYSNYTKILKDVIGLYEAMFNSFVDRVNEKNEFVEKSGFGNAPRQIKTAQDWAEAIIELQGLMNNFQNDYQNSFRMYVFSTPELMCKKMTLDKCRLTNAECTIKKNVFGKEDCVPKK